MSELRDLPVLQIGSFPSNPQVGMFFGKPDPPGQFKYDSIKISSESAGMMNIAYKYNWQILLILLIVVGETFLVKLSQMQNSLFIVKR